MAEDQNPSSSQQDRSDVKSSREDVEIESINDVPQNGAAASSEQKELEKLKNDYLYLRAEFDNFRKNAIKERSDLVKYGSERLARELLDVMDTFELALSGQVTPENLDGFVKGMELTAANLKNLLSRFGVTEIDPIGQNFDPSLHEALSSEPTSDYKPGQVCRVFKKAYKLHDRLIRPAQVVVAVEPKEETSGKDSGE